MTKNHLKKRSSKEHPGCMGGIFSLFDFNQHHSGRKLITEKSHADRSESSRISFDVANESLESSKSRNAKNEPGLYTYDTRKNPSTKKKTGGLPMKALIAEEMSKDFESKRRTPGVVARLMGLEAMPAEALLTEHTQELDNDPQKFISLKQQQQPKSNRDGRTSPQKSRASASKPTQEISLPVSQVKTVNCTDQRALSCTQDQSHAMQRQELWKEFEALKALKSRDNSTTQQLDELHIHLVEKHMLVHETLDEAKMALVHQKFIDAENLSTDEKLQQSKEFLDALEVLQSNKDLFLKFLQEPNSFFAKHLQDLHSTSQTPETMRTKIKSANARKTAEELKTEDISHGRYPMEGKKQDKQFQKQKGPRYLTEKEEEWRVISPSSGTKDRYKQYSTESAPVKSDACALPTRIVVLKPGPGSAQNVRSPSPPSWSPRSEAAFRSLGKGDRGTRDFLQEVRERLKLGLKENMKDDSKITQDDGRGQIHDGPKDPREIAREIARHVRESVTRDLTNDPSELGEVSASVTNFIGKRNLLNGSRTSSGEVGVSSDSEISSPVMKHSLDHTKRFDIPTSHPTKKCHLPESVVNGEAKKRLSERMKLSHVDEDKQQSRRNLSTLGKILALQEDEKSISRPKSPKDKNKINNGGEESEQLYGKVGHELGSDFTNHRDGDENGDISPKSLARSRSGPLSSTNLEKYNDDVQHTVSDSLARSWSGPLSSTINDKDNEDMQCRVSDVMRDNAHDSSSTNLPTEMRKTRNEGSIFEGTASSLTGSFLMMGRRSRSRKCDSLTEPDTSFQVPLDEVCDTPKEVYVESEKYKGRPEDLLSLEDPESQNQSIDGTEVENKEFKLPPDIGSGASPADTKGHEETIKEPLDWGPASVLSDALQSGDQTYCATKVIPPEQPPLNSPTFYSPIKQLPSQEPKGSTINNEKPEQPSPVSVLDSPFQEETPSPKGFKKISSDLQELRLRIRLLKFDESERPTDRAVNLLQGDGIVSDDHDCREAEIFSERTCNSASEVVVSPTSKLQSFIAENVDFEFLQLDDISCPKDKQSDFCYVRNVLVASGFTGDGISPRWNLPNHPLDPSLFEKIENLLGHDSEVDKTEAHESKWERHLLFDCINEVLLEILGPFSNHNPWLRDTKLNFWCMPAGKQLLRDTWAAISRNFYTRSEIPTTLENIIAKDMAKRGLWMELRDDVESIGCQVERAIFSDLIEEAMFDLFL